MTTVLLALADVGLGVQLEDQLNAAGLPTKWDAGQLDGPAPACAADVVIVDADHLANRLADAAARWRAGPAVPGVIAIGCSATARAQAPIARVTLLAPTARLTTLIAAIHDAAALRLAAGMRWPLIRAALRLPPVDDTRAAWQPTLVAARQLAIDIPRAALRWHVQHYATPTTRLDELREDRTLSVPELETIAHADGTRTVQTLVKLGPLDPTATARLLWTLGSLGALAFSAEIADAATPARRQLGELRAHLRGRVARLERSTYYDVLELTPLAEPDDIEAAYQLVGRRYAPRALAAYDLSELVGLVQPIWDLVEKARGVLLDYAQRGRYHDWLRNKLPELRTSWALDAEAITAAATAYQRGQHALGHGDVHKAMSDLAAACRLFPGHPEYEATLAWARYRVQVASGRDRLEAAVSERKTVEELLVGRKPWPRALVALALLSAAAGDAESARWHLHASLAIDPRAPAAVQLAHRLGMRRA